MAIDPNILKDHGKEKTRKEKSFVEMSLAMMASKNHAVKAG